MSHELIRPTGWSVLHDTDTGDEYVPVAAMLDFVHREKKRDITERELIQRMESVGWEWMRQCAVNPDDPSDSITVDLFRVPAGEPDDAA